MMSILDRFRLDGNVALVTGAGRGIGHALAVGLAEAGADIAGLYRENFQETQTKVEALGRRFLPLPCDLLEADQAKLESVVQQTVDTLGRLDILVNNAGIIRRNPAAAFTENDWDDIFHVNTKALFLLSQAAGNVMLQQGGGKIIQIASLLSFQGGVFVPAYTASKHAVEGITKALSNEWAAQKINVNAIAPGYIATDNTAPLRADPERSKALMARIPAGRWGKIEDLQGAVVFLASPAADYLHGSTITVDGGWMAR